MVEPKTFGSFHHRYVVRAFEQTIPNCCKARAPPELERGSTHEILKLLAECSFGQATVGGEIGDRHPPAHILPNIINRLSEGVRDRRTTSGSATIKNIRLTHGS
jgi:hypothetical protein